MYKGVKRQDVVKDVVDRKHNKDVRITSKYSLENHFNLIAR